MIINILIWIMLVEADHSFPVRMVVDDPEMMMNSHIYIRIYICRHIDSPPSLKAPHDQHTEVALLVREAVSDTSDNKKWVPAFSSAGSTLLDHGNGNDGSATTWNVEWNNPCGDGSKPIITILGE